jgi:hypothetical protein
MDEQYLVNISEVGWGITHDPGVPISSAADPRCGAGAFRPGGSGRRSS